MAVFTCPQCDHIQAVEDKHIGKTATCPKCKTQGAINKAGASDFPEEQSLSERSIRKADGGTTGLYVLMYGGSIDPPYTKSPLSLEWIIVDDPMLPISFAGVLGVRALRNATEDIFHYYAEVQWRVTGEPVAAWESRFLTFNLWGDHVRTLSSTEVRACPAQGVFKASPSWYLGSEAEGEEHLASIGYIARVRTQEGKVLRADTEFILREAQRFSEKFTEEDLEPQAPKK